MADFPGRARRTAAHDRLGFMVGEWMTSEEYPPAPWMPQGGSGQGRATIRWAVGGLCLVSDYQTRGSTGEAFEGHGVMTYDPAARLYTSHWYDPRTPAGIEGRGGFEGDSLVLRYRHWGLQGEREQRREQAERGVGDRPEGPAEQEIRSVTTPLSDRRFRMVGSSFVQGRWIEAVRIGYVRV